MPKTTLDKEKILLERIKKAKASLAQLKEQRKKDIGELAIKAGLDNFDYDLLKPAFNQLAQTLSNDHASNH